MLQELEELDETEEHEEQNYIVENPSLDLESHSNTIFISLERYHSNNNMCYLNFGSEAAESLRTFIVKQYKEAILGTSEDS